MKSIEIPEPIYKPTDKVKHLESGNEYIVKYVSMPLLHLESGKIVYTPWIYHISTDMTNLLTTPCVDIELELVNENNMLNK